MTETEIKDLLLNKRHWSSQDLKLLGIPWSYTKNNKGWKSKLLKEFGWFEQYRAIHQNQKLPKKIRSKPETEREMPESGYLVRSTLTGRYHIIVNGRCLCRQPPNWKRQIVTQEKPDAHCCAICRGLLETDPNNTRLTYKSMMRDAFYSSWEWKKARYETLKRYGAKCMLCGSEHYVVVDHIKPRRHFPELALELDNLQVLCNACNMGKSNDDYTDFRPDGEKLSDAEFDELKLVWDATNALEPLTP